MIKLLKEYYNFNINDYKTYHEGIIFFYNNEYYYFTKCPLKEENLHTLQNISNNLKKNNIKLHEFIYNKYNKLVTEEYVLMRIKVFISNIDIYDINKFTNKKMNEYLESYTSMNKIWESKIDYMELQINELSNSSLIINSFDYFAGISEIIIKFLKKEYNNTNLDLVLSHRELETINTIDFYNPLLITYDNKYKDICTYIRYTKDINLLETLLDKVDFNSKKYIFARLVFPFFYFEEVENIILHNKNEQKLIEIISNINKYELYIQKMQNYFNIYLFNWIKKE